MVIGKFYMERYYVTPTKLLTFFGLFGLLFSLIANSISFFFEFNDSHSEYISSGRLLNIFDYWGIMNQTCFYISVILWFIENYIIWFCISSFSPNHYIIYRNISSIIVIVKELIEEFRFRNYKVIISFFSLIGIFACSLIYNEIVIIRILNLDKYTAIEIDKRQKEETDNNKKSREYPLNSPYDFEQLFLNENSRKKNIKLEDIIDLFELNEKSGLKAPLKKSLSSINSKEKIKELENLNIHFLNISKYKLRETTK
jgi:hypothetical protein